MNQAIGTAAAALDDKRVCIHIPCYNCEKFIARTVSRIPWASMPAGLEYSVLFVDNASADGSWKEIERLRDELKATAILHPENRGYGGSVKTAFGHCFDNAIGYMAILHADGQYAPEELPRLISELVASSSALHFGSRLTGSPLKGGMPIYKWAANHVLTGIQNVVLGTHLSEFHSGYRLYRLRLIDKIPWRKLCDGFAFDNEIIFLLRQHGLGITESTIPTFYGDEKSNVPRIGTPLAILRNTWRYIRAVKCGRPDSLYGKQ
ncbi:MAG: glycosyltransferase family 2 protein [Phycisphaerae bacterium]